LDSGLAPDLGTARGNRPQANPAAVHDSARAIHRTGLVVHLEIVPGWAWPSTASTGWWWWWRT